MGSCYSDCVGSHDRLLQQEFVIANHIGIHPNAVLKTELIKEEEWMLISKNAVNDTSPEVFFICILAKGIGAAFNPHLIFVHLGDFKSNENCHLTNEEYPMIGLPGASAYLHPKL